MAAIDGTIGFMKKEKARHFGMNMCGIILDNGYVSNINGRVAAKEVEEDGMWSRSPKNILVVIAVAN